MVLTLHHFPPSAPSRAALLTAKAIGLDIDIQIVNLFKKEQLSEEFIKVNITKQQYLVGSTTCSNLLDQSSTYHTYSRRW